MQQGVIWTKKKTMNKRLTKAITVTLSTTRDVVYKGSNEIRAIEEKYTTQHVNIFNENKMARQVRLTST